MDAPLVSASLGANSLSGALFFLSGSSIPLQVKVPPIKLLIGQKPGEVFEVFVNA